MTDLELLRGTPPRDEATARRFAARLVPAWTFLGYGLIWLFVALLFAMVVTVGALFLFVGLRLRHGDRIAAAVGLAAFGLAWWPFARRVALRRAHVRRLVRDGVLLEAVVFDTRLSITRSARATFATLEYEAGGARRMPTFVVAEGALVEGARVPLIVGPDGSSAAILPDGPRLAMEPALFWNGEAPPET